MGINVATRNGRMRWHGVILHTRRASPYVNLRDAASLTTKSGPQATMSKTTLDLALPNELSMA